MDYFFILSSGACVLQHVSTTAASLRSARLVNASSSSLRSALTKPTAFDTRSGSASDQPVDSQPPSPLMRYFVIGSTGSYHPLQEVSSDSAQPIGLLPSSPPSFLIQAPSASASASKPSHPTTPSSSTSGISLGSTHCLRTALRELPWSRGS